MKCYKNRKAACKEPECVWEKNRGCKNANILHQSGGTSPKTKEKKLPQKKETLDSLKSGTPEDFFQYKHYLPSDAITSIAVLVSIAKSNRMSCAILPRIPKTIDPVQSSKDLLYWDANAKVLHHKLEVVKAIQSCKNKITKGRKQIRHIFGTILLGDTKQNIFHSLSYIYDIKWEEVEIFDPFGYDMSVSDKDPDIFISPSYASRFRNTFDMSEFNATIKDFFYNRIKAEAVYLPMEWCPIINIQNIQEKEKINDEAEFSGYCYAWSIWWIHKRLLYHNMNRKKLLDMELKKMRKNPFSVTAYVRAYSKKIADLTKFIMLRSLMASGLSKNKASKELKTFLDLTASINILRNKMANETNDKKFQALFDKFWDLIDEHGPVYDPIAQTIYKNLPKAMEEVDAAFEFI